MPQWEYTKIDLNQISGTTDDIDLLNTAGRDGWELVGITTNNMAYLKRQLEDVEPAQRRPAALSSRRK